MSSETSTDPGLRPWQLFLLAGMLAATGVVLVSTGQTLPGIIVLSITVVVSSFVAVAGYRSLSPLVTPEAAHESVPVGGRARAALEREKALVLRTIKELEFDHAMGKTATADFEEMRDRLRLRAVGLIRQLDGSDYKEAIARDLAARAGHPVAPAPGAPNVPDAAVPAHAPGPSPFADLTAAPAPPASAVAPRDCAQCATSNDGDARFCKRCGASLVTEAVS